MQENKTTKRKNGFWHKLKERKAWAPLMIGLVAVVIIVVAVVVIVLNLNRETSEQGGEANNKAEYSITPDPETGEPPLFGNDPNKDNSGEAFVEFEKRIIASQDYSVVVKNDARIAIAVHYNAIDKYNEAIDILKEVDTAAVFGEQLRQFYLAYADAYEGLQETEHANEYRTLAEQVEL